MSQPKSCRGGFSSEFTAGCEASKARLTPTDILRKSEPDYKLGWNAYREPASPVAVNRVIDYQIEPMEHGRWYPCMKDELPFVCMY